MKNLLKTSLIASLLWMAPLEQGLAQTSDNSIFFDDFESSPSGTPGIVEDPKQSDRAFSWQDFNNSSGSPDPRRITVPEGKHRFEIDLLAKPGSVTPELEQYLQNNFGFNINPFVTDRWQTIAFDFKIHQEVSFTVGDFLRDTLGFANIFGGSGDVLFDNFSLQNLAATDATDPGGADFQPTTEPQPQSVSFIRIGDFDGFGFGKGERLTAANGGSVNKDGKGLLASGDFLPDHDGNGYVRNKNGYDNFDNRSEEERSLSNDYVTSNGFINAASVGSLLTDVALSKSQPKEENIPTAHKANFVFDFFVDSDKINPRNPIFFNLIFGDYDVKSAEIEITGANGLTTTKSLRVQNSLGKDGLIQSAFSQLDFHDVFIANDKGYDGYLEVEFKAPGEPYMAFDFVELSTAKIGTTPASVPEPSTILGGLAFGAFVTKLRRKRKQKAAK